MLSQRLMGATASAGAPTAVSVFSSVAGTTLSSGVTSVTFTGHAVGDMLVAAGGGQTLAEPTYTAGWTRINGGGVFFTVNRSVVVVYFIANTTSSITVTFTSSGTSGGVYSNGIIFKQANSIGASAVTQISAGSTSIPYSALTLDQTNGTSAVVVVTYAGNITAISSPPTWTLINGGTSSLGGYATTLSSNVSSGTLTASSSGLHLSVICEIKA